MRRALKMLGRAIALACLGLALAPGLAAQTPAASPVTSRLNKGLLKLGEDARLVIEVESAENVVLGALPVVDGIEVSAPSAPSLRTFSSFDLGTGRRVFSQTWTFRVPLRPLRAGDFEIPSIDVDVGGTVFRTIVHRLSVVEDMRGEELGLLRLSTSAERVVAGQPFTIEVRFGWDASFGNKINYVNLSLPWWDDLPGTVEIELPETTLASQKFSIPLNASENIEAQEIEPTEERGRTFRTFIVRRGMIASRTGTLDLTGNFMEFGRGVERGSLLSRSLEKLESYFVSSPGALVEVVPLPEEGRPFEFSGAVGSFSARAQVDNRDVFEGESIKLTVEWTGEGNLEFFRPPDPARVDAFEDFRVYGTTDEKGLDFRRVIYDIAPISDRIEEMPALPLSAFDPARMEYVTVNSQPIPLRVRPLEGEGLADEGTTEEVEDDIRDIRAVAAGGRAGWRPGLRTLGGALLGVPVFWLGLRVAVRRRRGDPSRPIERRYRVARKHLARDLAAAAGDAPADLAARLSALHAYLAALSREPDQAWVGRDVDAWFRNERPAALERHADDARALAELIDRLERSVFGGEDAGVPRADVLAVADRVRGGLL